MTSLFFMAAGLTACSYEFGDNGFGGNGGAPSIDLEDADVEINNILLVSIDTTRRDAFGRWGSRNDTDFIDSLLDQAYVLEDHRSCANWTQSSMACALTGQSTVDLQMEPQSGDNKVSDLDEALRTVAVDFQTQGFDTAMVTTNPFIGRQYPLSNGYLSVEEEGDGAASWVLNTALNRLDTMLDGGDDFFLHVHYMDPHDPYLPEVGYRDGYQDLANVPYDMDTKEGQDQAVTDLERGNARQEDLVLEHLLERYWGEIRYMDDQFELFWEALDERGVLEDTLVILMTDHGEQFMEHGAMEHNKSVHYGEVNALAAFLHPALTPDSWTGRTVHQDLMPTAMQLMGVETDLEMTGKPVGNRNETWSRYSFRYATGTGAMATVDKGDKRLYYHFDGDKALYDVADNPTEEGSGYNRQDEDLDALWNAMNTLIDDVQDYAPHLRANNTE